MAEPSQPCRGGAPRRALAVGIAGVLASAAVLAGGAVWASRQLDELQDRNETKVVAHAVGQVFGMLERNAHDYAWSDDAALRASLALDWASAQVGQMLWTSWGYNYVFAVAEDGSSSYGLVDGRPTDDAAAAHLGPDLDRLIARARVVAGEPVAVSATLAAGERLVAAAAARITWRTPTVASGDLQVMHLVLGKRLDRRLVDELAGHLEIREPRLRAATAADAGAGRWALAGLAGVPFAVVEWAPARPGARALASLAPPMAAAFAVLLLSACAAGGVLVRADRRRRASEGRFRDFAAAGSDWFWETDAAGR
jgi:sensor domain CHASE-containing protein